MRRDTEDFRIISVLRYSDFHPAFGLPVAVLPGDDKLWVQVRDQFSQRIVDFHAIEDVSVTTVDRIADIGVKVGRPYVHAFFDRQGQLYLDTAEGLRTILRIAFESPATPLSTKLAISEQLADAPAQKLVREDLLEIFSKVFGAAAARSYENSAVRSRFWALLESAAVSAEVRERIQRLRPRLLASVGDYGKITVDASLLNPSDLTIELKEIVAKLAGEFRGISGHVGKLPRVDLSSVRNLHDPTAIAIINAVKLSPRQEERVALLMRGVLLHPLSGMEALRLHRESASFARTATEYMRQSLDAGPIDEKGREIILAKAVRRLFTDCFPLQRGKLLYYLAVHLGEFPILRSAISASLDRSHAFSVERYRSDTAEVLASYS
ncbi:hypothetical protein [Phenylobacterium sp.]|uniref:hypothetical protein n=1 Tax=Phenylobacterium sp. TaxID=1871053 RepID=UPI002E34D755|nr:hypothetical protein [Phenylobacterium sp.]HEX4712842.1 hypothetical protein [Phenylobacterium sp.]